MENCPYGGICGGCQYREEGLENSRRCKQENFIKIMAGLHCPPEIYDEPVFIPDGVRRRAALAFCCRNGNITLGFNARKSAKIIDIENCALLLPELNRCLPEIKMLLQNLCSEPFHEKRKKRKPEQSFLSSGDVWLCRADNGTDVVLEFDQELELAHRMAIVETAQKSSAIIRISHRRKNNTPAETIIEKLSPVVNISGYEVFVPAGCFMQASKPAETALIKLVSEYMEDTPGKIADLFCGMGTFSYPLSKNKNNKITAVDSSPELLEAFSGSIRRGMISNIEIKSRNLFRYPLDESELKNFNAVVFDPPRAGAAAQAAKLASLPETERPEKIIAVSCNPKSFVTDANLLIDGGYRLWRVAMVDQFVFSGHMELVAAFLKK